MTMFKKNNREFFFTDHIQTHKNLTKLFSKHYCKTKNYNRYFKILLLKNSIFPVHSNEVQMLFDLLFIVTYIFILAFSMEESCPDT